MTLLKRAWSATSRDTVYFLLMGGSLIILGAAWYRVGETEDLGTLANSRAYELGVLVMGTAVIVGLTGGLMLSLIVRRWWPRALPVDPDNPPQKMLFLDSDGPDSVLCHCHGTPVKDGAEIWHWPLPALVICSKGRRKVRTP
ncbi:hypothetical protein AB0E08_08115 [Streptomyces sp. NPDC048281]|uniref:hypothetical protein n=1 Tax=Streptomyces sp. NPDC048281 TaxID=3154715 RepID=UPI003448EA0E